MKTSLHGVELICHFEGCRLQAYLCPANVWTIGYGHTKGVKEGDVIDQEEAEALLIDDLAEFEEYVNHAVEIHLKQCQFDAIVAWTFNLGPGNLRESTLLNRINYGPLSEVPFQIQRWTRAGGQVLEGLVRRRKAESLLWKGMDWRSYESD